ncbi:LIC_13387 family protein [Adhaeribacter pallidiroseus]|uniref:Uncharacterized protein n=1 Tax=Adhaeribacter pallidiroseus TaxID=2072847 RepID=A0A369QP28_9BACT|nr:hypothetical protein [Adhaeribacter pallidiroseus]RDC65435.1 hypothetical protein AHMF7616_04065 [Adhaeribacter pallidiroseus]
MTPKYLWEIGSCILILLGAIHLYYTFLTNKFSSDNQTLMAAMKTSFMLLTKQTTIWKAWIGFNASHSMGVIFIGIVNFYLAVNYFAIFETDVFFFLFTISVVAFYVWLAKKYWFKIPFTGLVIAFICYIVSGILVFTTG